MLHACWKVCVEQGRAGMPHGAGQLTLDSARQCSAVMWSLVLRCRCPLVGDVACGLLAAVALEWDTLAASPNDPTQTRDHEAMLLLSCMAASCLSAPLLEAENTLRLLVHG